MYVCACLHALFSLGKKEKKIIDRFVGGVYLFSLFLFLDFLFCFGFFFSFLFYLFIYLFIISYLFYYLFYVISFFFFFFFFENEELDEAIRYRPTQRK